MKQAQKKGMELAQQSERVVQIPLDNLQPDPGNRKIGGFDQAKLKHLAESIQAVGVQQPAVVRAKGPGLGFEIVAGERRWRAAKLAGQTTLPCVVRELDDTTVLKIRTIENLQREDIHPLDEASGFARLLDGAVYDVDNLAQEIGRSASYIYQRLKLKDLIPKAREMMIKGKIAAGHAVLIARLQPDQQKEVLTSHLYQYGDGAPSVRRVDEFIREQILMDLSKTSFSKADDDLVPKAGPCSTCQKRTGNQPALFADVCKKDYCADPACFQAKLDAMVKRQQALLIGEQHLLVREGCGSDKKLPKGTLDNYDWSECKQKDKGAIRCLVVDGTGRGRLTWGKKRESYRHQTSPQEKAAEARKKREIQTKRDVRRRVWSETFAAFDAKAGHVAEYYPVELFRIAVLYAWDQLASDHQVSLAKIEGWEAPVKKKNEYGNGRDEQGQAYIAKLDRKGLQLFMIKVALVGQLVVWEYGNNDPKHLYAAARVVGLDPTDIETRTRYENKAIEKDQAAKKKKIKKKSK